MRAQSNDVKAQGNTSTSPLQPDVLLRADFVIEDLSEEKGLETFSKLVNIEHINEVLFNLKAVVEAAKADGKNPADILADRYISHATS
jgi:hypothetical protein